MIQFTPSSGAWCAVLGKESLSIGAGVVEYFQLGDSGDVVQYRSATLSVTAATLQQYQDALRENCGGLKAIPVGLGRFLGESWIRETT